ncbi:MAG: multi-sensor signal transduction histidine kinase, partial [bacterium]|nr:multi-sensor signal transduction histidine kinase [bacterium]
MLAALIEELTPQMVRRIVPRLREQTPAWEGHVEGILLQIVTALRQGHVDASGCDVKLTFTAGVESFLQVIGVVESVVYDTIDERRATPAVREMRLLAAWFMAVRDKTLRSALRGLTATLDALPDAIHVEGTDGRFVWLNRSMATFIEQLTGLSRDEVIGRDANAILDRAKVPIPESFREMIRRTHERVWSGESFHEDYLLPTPEGPRWRSHSVAPVRAPDETIEAMAVANRDIHARKVAEARLQLLSKVGTLHEIAEYDGVLGAVARLSIPELADWCVVDVVEDGRWRRAKAAHRDPSKVALAEEILQIEHAGGSLEALGAGIVRVGDEIPGLFANSRRLADVVARLDASSIMIVPFVVLGAPIAVAVFVFNPESGRRQVREDLTLEQEMSRSAEQIIENARLHEKLRQSEQRFRIALSRSNISVFEEDTEFRVNWIYNSPFGGDVTGATIRDSVPADVAAQLEAVKRRVLETGEGAATACDFFVASERRHFLLRYEALRGVGGVVGITGAAIDVTELKRTQDELAQALGFRDRVIGVLGHDLRNPLGAVTGLAGLLLQQEQLSDKVRDGLKRMLQAGDRMNEIIETVLEFTRLRYGAGPQLSLAPAELDGIAREIVDELSVSHPGRAIEIVT